MLKPEHIIQNRSSRAEYRPQSGDEEGIKTLQDASYKRALMLNKIYDVILTVVDNPENDFVKSADVVASRVALPIIRVGSHQSLF